MSDGERRVEVGAMVFHGTIGFVHLAEAAVLFGLIRLLSRLMPGFPGEPEALVWTMQYLAGVTIALVLVAASYHFVCADAHRRSAKGGRG